MLIYIYMTIPTLKKDSFILLFPELMKRCIYYMIANFLQKSRNYVRIKIFTDSLHDILYLF